MYNRPTTRNSNQSNQQQPSSSFSSSSPGGNQAWIYTKEISHRPIDAKSEHPDGQRCAVSKLYWLSFWLVSIKSVQLHKQTTPNVSIEGAANGLAPCRVWSHVRECIMRFIGQSERRLARTSRCIVSIESASKGKRRTALYSSTERERDWERDAMFISAAKSNDW